MSLFRMITSSLSKLLVFSFAVSIFDVSTSLGGPAFVANFFYKNKKYVQPILRDSVDSFEPPEMVDQYFSALIKKSQDTNVEWEERQKTEERLSDDIQRILKYYLLSRELEMLIFEDEHGAQREPPLNLIDNGHFEDSLKRRTAFYRDRLAKIRKMNPKKFDDIIYGNSLFGKIDLHCDCQKLLNPYLVRETEGLDQSKNREGLAKKVASVDTIHFLLERGCRYNTNLLYYHEKGKSCTDPYVDRLLSSKDGVIDGYLERFGLHSEGGGEPPPRLLGECPLQMVDDYSEDVLSKRTVATHVVGKGESALNAPCTLLTIRFDVNNSKMGSETHNLQEIRYRGSKAQSKAPQILKRTNPEDAKKLDQILSAWRQKQKVLDRKLLIEGEQ